MQRDDSSPGKISMASLLRPKHFLLTFLCGAIALAAITTRAAPTSNVQAAAGFSRFAGEFCGATPKSIAAYKEALRRKQTPSPEFESDWNLGWANALDRIIEYRDLRFTAPKDFADRVRDDCSLVKW
jgi:hypothetical protein